MTDAELDNAFAALAHPIRRAILARLVHGPATVNLLAEPFDMSLPAVSKHIKVLEKAGLINKKQIAQSRPCSINPAALKQVANWAEQYREIWDARFTKMQSILNQEIKEPDNEH